jgi:hypothetical protein
MKKIFSYVLLFSLVLTIAVSAMPNQQLSSSRINSQQMTDIVGGRYEAVICSLAFTSFDAWVGVALWAGSVSGGVGVGVTVVVGITAALVCS